MGCRKETKLYIFMSIFGAAGAAILNVFVVELYAPKGQRKWKSVGSEVMMMMMTGRDIAMLYAKGGQVKPKQFLGSSEKADKFKHNFHKDTKTQSFMFCNNISV